MYPRLKRRPEENLSSPEAIPSAASNKNRSAETHANVNRILKPLVSMKSLNFAAFVLHVN